MSWISVKSSIPKFLSENIKNTYSLVIQCLLGLFLSYNPHLVFDIFMGSKWQGFCKIRWYPLSWCIHDLRCKVDRTQLRWCWWVQEGDIIKYPWCTIKNLPQICVIMCNHTATHFKQLPSCSWSHVHNKALCVNICQSLGKRFVMNFTHMIRESNLALVFQISH